MPPYYGSQNVSFEKGVNFAVAGATALEHAFLESRGIHYAYTNVSLRVQLKSFKESLPNLCGSPKGNEFIRLRMLNMICFLCINQIDETVAIRCNDTN